MKKIVVGIVLFLAVGLYLHLVATKELKVITLVLVGLVIVALCSGLVLMTWLAVERLKMMRAKRIEQEKEAHVKIVTAGHQVFIRETDLKAHWRAAHLDPRIYANKQYSEPTQTEVAAYQIFHAPRVIGQPAVMLSAQTQVDLLAALDSVQRCLVVGASDSGKTTLLQWLVSRRLSTSKVVVIDPHAYPDKWPEGCTVIGAGRNYNDIDKALTALVQLMTKRYEEIGRGLVAEMAHRRITILIDEWRAITRQLGKSAEEAIRTLLTESRKAAFSVFVASHSDRAKPLGLEGEYDLKDGFAVVRLSIANGQRQATIDTGNGEIPATLPGPFLSSQSRIIDNDDLVKLEVEPNRTEAHILELYDAGENVSTIAVEVFGQKGGNQNEKVRAVLSKFDRV